MIKPSVISGLFSVGGGEEGGGGRGGGGGERGILSGDEGGEWQ